MPTNANDIATWIEIAKISGYLSIADINKKLMQNTLVQDPLLPRKMYCLRKDVEFGYVHDNGSPNLDLTNNYLISLIGSYAPEARRKLGNAQGIVVIPINPSLPTYLVQQREYPQFEIGQPNSPLNDGDTTLTINDDQIAPQTPDAPFEIHVDGLQEGQALNDRSSYTTVYSPGQYVITFNSPVRTGNVFQIKYPVQLNLTYQTSSQLDTTYTAQLVNVQTKTLVNTAGNIFIVQANTINVSNFTLFCVSTADEVFIMQWNATVKNIGGVVTIYNDSYSVIQDDFAGALNVVISADQINHGVAIAVTGISGKTINCRAIFTNTPNALT